MREIPSNIIRGFSMGAADIVPGVSGGTIALVLDIYRRLIASIREGSSSIGRLLKGDIAGFKRGLAMAKHSPPRSDWPCSASWWWSPST